MKLEPQQKHRLDSSGVASSPPTEKGRFVVPPAVFISLALFLQKHLRMLRDAKGLQEAGRLLAEASLRFFEEALWRCRFLLATYFTAMRLAPICIAGVPAAAAAAVSAFAPADREGHPTAASLEGARSARAPREAVWKQQLLWIGVYSGDDAPVGVVQPQSSGKRPQHHLATHMTPLVSLLSLEADVFTRRLLQPPAVFLASALQHNDVETTTELLERFELPRHLQISAKLAEAFAALRDSLSGCMDALSSTLDPAVSCHAALDAYCAALEEAGFSGETCLATKSQRLLRAERGTAPLVTPGCASEAAAARDAEADGGCPFRASEELKAVQQQAQPPAKRTLELDASPQVAFPAEEAELPNPAAVFPTSPLISLFATTIDRLDVLIEARAMHEARLAALLLEVETLPIKANLLRTHLSSLHRRNTAVASLLEQMQQLAAGTVRLSNAVAVSRFVSHAVQTEARHRLVREQHQQTQLPYKELVDYSSSSEHGRRQQHQLTEGSLAAPQQLFELLFMRPEDLISDVLFPLRGQEEAKQLAALLEADLTGETGSLINSAASQVATDFCSWKVRPEGWTPQELVALPLAAKKHLEAVADDSQAAMELCYAAAARAWAARGDFQRALAVADAQLSSDRELQQHLLDCLIQKALKAVQQCLQPDKVQRMRFFHDLEGLHPEELQLQQNAALSSSSAFAMRVEASPQATATAAHATARNATGGAPSCTGEADMQEEVSLPNCVMRLSNAAAATRAALLLSASWPVQTCIDTLASQEQRAWSGAVRLASTAASVAGEVTEQDDALFAASAEDADEAADAALAAIALRAVSQDQAQLSCCSRGLCLLLMLQTVGCLYTWRSYSAAMEATRGAWSSWRELHAAVQTPEGIQRVVYTLAACNGYAAARSILRLVSGASVSPASDKAGSQLATSKAGELASLSRSSFAGVYGQLKGRGSVRLSNALPCALRGQLRRAHASVSKSSAERCLSRGETTSAVSSFAAEDGGSGAATEAAGVALSAAAAAGAQGDKRWEKKSLLVGAAAAHAVSLSSLPSGALTGLLHQLLRLCLAKYGEWRWVSARVLLLQQLLPFLTLLWQQGGWQPPVELLLRPRTAARLRDSLLRHASALSASTALKSRVAEANCAGTVSSAAPDGSEVAAAAAPAAEEEVDEELGKTVGSLRFYPVSEVRVVALARLGIERRVAACSLPRVSGEVLQNGQG
ncbi:hypothetical protein cyc_00553 [Cyclospora cayetanensis]|uniref:Uncharacterized protein n=1 Tax=Cyclospora cayetanensis TaxID=88456 RepID=A0A1D3D3U4_9EIME|nr:hypothetical protein cyc_00553 [Cyclospora cayetanensis]